MYKLAVILLCTIAVSSCAIFESHSNSRLEYPDISDSSYLYSLVILEEDSDTSLSNSEVEKLIHRLEEFNAIQRIYYNENPVSAETISSPVIIINIEYTRNGLKDETVTKCLSNNMSLFIVPIPCSWKISHTISAAKYELESEQFESYYTADRTAEISGWPNLFGLILFPFSLWHETLLDSIEKDIVIALDRLE